MTQHLGPRTAALRPTYRYAVLGTKAWSLVVVCLEEALDVADLQICCPWSVVIVCLEDAMWSNMAMWSKDGSHTKFI